MTIPLPAELRLAKHAQLRASALYLDDPQVSLIDVGLRIHERARQVTDEITVRVHVRRKLRGPAFEALAEMQPERVIDERKVGFPVDVVEGNYRLQAFPEQRNSGARRSGVFNPLRGGISISNEWFYTYGTLGGFVRDRQTGEVMILSNWHVLAGSGYARPGLRIYQPGTGDGGWGIYTIARLARHAMDQGIDAALATLTGERPYSSEELGIGPVSGSAAPMLGMRLVKSGRTSGITHGVVTGIEGIQTLSYRGLPRIVRHVMHISQDPSGGTVSAPGDSGSWWLDESTHRAVGLHFAGNDEPEYGLAIAMPYVLEALDVDVVSGAQPEAGMAWTRPREMAVSLARRPEPMPGSL